MRPCLGLALALALDVGGAVACAGVVHVLGAGRGLRKSNVGEDGLHMGERGQSSSEL